jgi:NAD+ synthase
MEFEKNVNATVGDSTTPCQVNEENSQVVADYITQWLKDYINKSGTKGYVLGVSGGIDSAVVSTLCARTGFPLTVVEMPIHQDNDQVLRAKEHIQTLKDNYDNVTSIEIDLTDTYDGMVNVLRTDGVTDEEFNFTMANTRARLRMTTLYAIAGQKGLLVCGTGNRVEDFGVFFMTKFGDSAVDVSPIADLMKSEVYVVAKAIGVSSDIINTTPTDGLHGDGRTDEEQLKCTYPELEWAMEYHDDYLEYGENGDTHFNDKEVFMLNEREQEVLSNYLYHHEKGKHKSLPIPVCGIPGNLFN